MTTERVQMKTKLTQERYDLKRFRMEAVTILDSLRTELNVVPPIDELDLDRAEEMFKDLITKWRACRALKENIVRLEKALYE
jgi:hypothetical protein